MGNKYSPDDLLKVIDILFGKVFSYNYKLLNLCNEKDYNPNYTEVFDFYITSNAMSLLKNFRYNYIESPGILLNARCIIEGLAIKEAFKKEDFSALNFELLKHQSPLIEYHQYKKFKDSYDLFLIPEKLEKEYNDAYDFFKENLGSICDKELKDIVRSPLPFACNSKLSFKSIVKDELGDSWAEKYSFLSSLIHPTSNAYKTDETILWVLLDVIGLIKIEFGNLPQGLDLKALSTLVFNRPEAMLLVESVKSECTDLEKVINNFKDNFGDNYVSDTFHKISMTIQEMTFDMIFGLREQMKSKWKVLIEILAGFYDIYLLQENLNDSFELLQSHDNYNILCIFGSKDDKEKHLLETYKVYKAKYPKGVGYEDFCKLFELTTGYTIDELGKLKSLTSLVNRLADVFKTEHVFDWVNIIKMNYVEAQMISHANGYMWFANTGAWADVNNMYVAFNNIMGYLCYCMSENFNDLYQEQKVYKYKKTSNILKSTSNHIRNNTKNIYDILAKVPNPVPTLDVKCEGEVN